MKPEEKWRDLKQWVHYLKAKERASKDIEAGHFLRENLWGLYVEIGRKKGFWEKVRGWFLG